MSYPADLPDTELDPDTLVERVTDPGVARTRTDQLRAEIRDAIDAVDELRARGDLVDVLRQLDELDESLAQAKAAVDRAEVVGSAAQQHVARGRLAQVHIRRGEFPESTMITTELLGVADQFGPVIEAVTYQLAGTNAYAQGHWSDAAAAFEHALELRERLGLPEADDSRIAAAAARRRQHREEDTP